MHYSLFYIIPRSGTIIIHVYAHAGNYGNVQADLLANRRLAFVYLLPNMMFITQEPSYSMSLHTQLYSGNNELII